MKCLRPLLLSGLWTLSLPAQDSVVVFNEVMYHPPAGQTEWIELHNVMSVNVDLSAWQLTGGADLVFPDPTVIPPGGFVLVKGGAGTAPAGALGPFTGQLDNGGETVRLRNVSGRVMDTLSYADDGHWPAGADGSGATLARRNPVAPGGLAENWAASSALGGTPGAVNFPTGPATGPVITLVGLADAWVYNQTGPALTSNWAESSYAAGAGGWSSGPGIFAYENAALPAPTGTVLADPVAAGVAVQYFQKTFAFSGDPARTLLKANLLIDDGAVVYLNGHEVLRRNIAEGTVNGNTRAQTAVGSASFTGPLTLPTDWLVNGTNILSVSVHQSASLQPYVVLTGGGLALAEELGALDSAADLALASKGAVAFARDVLSGYPAHTIPHLNDAAFGNSNSWIGNSNNSFCGISLGAAPLTLRSIAFGRDNTGTFADRTIGIYTLQYTQVANPTAATPDASWTNIGTLNYQSAGGGANFAVPSRRHRFNFTAVQATGIRLTCPGNGLGTGACVDEIELYEQPGTVIVPQPITLAPASGYTLTWDGNNGANPGINVPSNLARAADGATPFASGELGPSLSPPPPYHLVANINDGKYGNANSWIGANAANQYAAVKFGGLVSVNKVAWGRDNTNTFPDRSLGTYTIQVTTVPSPGTTTGETGDPATGWKTVGTVTYAFSDPAFTQNLRHEFAIAQGDAAIPATALRIKVSDPATGIDELEAYGTEQPDVVFGMSLTAAELLPPPGSVPIVLNEIGGSLDTVWRVELRNTGSVSVDLATLALNGHPLPAGTLGAGAMIVLDETQLGFRPFPGDAVSLTVSGILLDAVRAKRTGRARSGEKWLVPTAATFGAANTFALHTEVAINELMYHAPPFSSTPTTPVTNNPLEWIELKNRTALPVDLSGWNMDGEVKFTFPPNTTLAANGFLVIAGAGGTPPAGSIGPFSGSLNNSGGRIELEDASGNPADEVRYYGAGWSDGGGSSAELRDSRADHASTVSGAWQDSDESGKSAWQTFSYRMTSSQAFGPAPAASTWRELRLGMLDAGECLVDDISVVRDPDGVRQEVVQNGTFESAADHWRFLGNHRTSSVIADPDNAANHVLRLSASGPAETNHNHIEGTFTGNTPLTDGALYEVSFRARWLAGTNQLNVKAYYSRLAKTVEMPIPSNLGTPGAANSRAIANAGPLLTALRHDPPVPAAGQNAIVSVAADDPDNVSSLTLYYRVNGAVSFSTVPMALSSGTWSATVPAQSAGVIVQFYVLAQDGAGATSTAPAAGANSRALIQWADNQSSALPAHELRLIMLNADRYFLIDTINRVSNERQPGTLIYRGSEVFYDAGVRLQGTPAGRVRDGEAYPGYDIGFAPDHLFRGVHDNISIDRSGRTPTVRGQDEIYLKHTFHRGGLPCTFDDLCYFIAPATVHTGTAILQMAGYGGGFVSSQFDEDGTVFNFDVTYDPQWTAAAPPESVKPPVPFLHVATDFTNLGNDKEQYRGPLDIRAARRKDNYAPAIAWCQAMAAATAQLPVQAAPKMDLHASLRCAALVNLWSVADTYFTGGFQHNLRLFVPDSGTGLTLLPWDNDFIPQPGAAANAALYPTNNNLGDLIGSSPAIRRIYLGHMHNLCQTVFNASALNPWLLHYGTTVGQNMTGTATFVTNRCNYVLGQMPANVPFAITTNAGSDFTVASHTTLLQGNGWINVRDLRVAETGLMPQVTWTSETAWTFTMPLLPGANAITLQALDYSGAVTGTDTITITNSLSAPDPRDFLRLTELHYHPANPSTAAEIAVSTSDTEFEFIELQNTAPVSLDVSGVHFTSGVDFTFPASTTLAAGQYAVLVRNVAAFEARYGTAIPLAGTFSPDSLNNGGETLTLNDVTGRVIFSFTWEDAWFPHADGAGRSMVPLNPPDAASLATASGWGLSSQVHGNPGTANGAIPGTEFAGWQHQNFTATELDDPAVSSSGADPAREGITHLVRYALGLTPQSSALSRMPAAVVAGGTLRIDFRRLKRAVDLTYSVQTSGDLGTWTAQTETPVVLQDNGDGTETVRLETPAAGTRRFVRLRVETKP